MTTLSTNHTTLPKLLNPSTKSLITTVLPVPSFIGKEIDLDNYTFVTVKDAALTESISSYVGHNANRSFTLQPKKSNDQTDDDDHHELNEKEKERTQIGMGYGWHEIEFEKTKIRMLFQMVGDPVGTLSGIQIYQTLVLLLEGLGQYAIAQRFCDYIISLGEKTKDRTFNIYQYNVQHDYWQLKATKPARSLDSVVLPEGLKASLIQDIDEFVAPETYQWYKLHGIPYKRSYLLFGPPGSGKSSIIQAIAGHYKRNVCFLQPIGPQFTDDAFTSCIQSAPKNALIVLEDIDAFFGRDRKALHSNCPLTFSGLLNGLDGVSSADGQIFILTTNFVDRLDEALMRSGRVDRRIEFPDLNPDLARDMFLQFYPGQEKYATEFQHSLTKKLESLIAENKKLCMADLQQHFIKHRRSKAEVTASDLEDITGEEFSLLKEQAEKPKFIEEKKEEDKKEDKKEEDKNEDKKRGEKRRERRKKRSEKRRKKRIEIGVQKNVLKILY